ncbi:MAG: hypothetical protein JWR69_927 [Pedosphaera sp.]|nr:hypothetical protein [Pedosphaera sp.]
MKTQAPNINHGIRRALTLPLLLAVTLAITSGCAILHQPVPETKISGSIGGQKFSLVNPKNTVVDNLAVTAGTNGTATLTIGHLSSANDSNVVSGAYAGAAQIVTATGDSAAKAFQAGAAAAGAALGAAAK